MWLKELVPRLGCQLSDRFPDLVSIAGEGENDEGKKCIRIYLKRKAEKQEKKEILRSLVLGGYPKRYPVVFDFSGEVAIQETPDDV